MPAKQLIPDSVVMKSLVLIGMPAWQSTLGVLLAKRMAMGFADTDLMIQEQAGMCLREYQALNGMDAFRVLEAEVLSSVASERTVLATGGSAIYYSEAMEHLKGLGPVLFLDVPLEVIRARIGDLGQRGVVMHAGQTLDDLFAERRPCI